MTKAKGSSKQKKVKIAAFDIDGTIFRSSLLIELVNELVREKIFSKSAEQEIEDDYHAWLNREGNYDTYIYKVVEVYDKHIVGCRFKDVIKAGKVVMAKQKSRVYRYTRDLVKTLKKEGYFLIAISGSPVFMVRAFAKKMGFDISFGKVLEIKNGICTDHFIQTDSVRNKDKLLKRVVKEFKINPDWKRSVAVGDSASDISMLKIVGRPIAFNPDGILIKRAKRNKWKIITERKNVVYDIKEFDFIHYKNQ